MKEDDFYTFDGKNFLNLTNKSNENRENGEEKNNSDKENKERKTSAPSGENFFENTGKLFDDKKEAPENKKPSASKEKKRSSKEKNIFPKEKKSSSKEKPPKNERSARPIETDRESDKETPENENKNEERRKSEDRRNPKNQKTAKIRKISYLAASGLFILTLAFLFALSLDFPQRKTFSESEKRELAKFPKISFSTFFSGEYFDDIGVWFSDTFPYRDSFVSAAGKIKKLSGQMQKVHNFSENKGEAIPKAEDESQDIVEVEPETAEKADGDDLLKPALPDASNGQNAQQKGENVLEQSFGSIYVYGDTAYEYYNFTRETADKYASVVNKAGQNVKSAGINVYNMIIPTSIDITLNEKTRGKLNSSDQKEAINYINSKISPDVKTVQIFDLLKAHKDEYIYFRTDHHWTALGAYYAYAQLMNVKGVQYEPLSGFTEYQFKPYLGSFYTGSNKSPELAKNPDAVFAYMPKYDISFKMMQKGDSDYVDWPLITDAGNYSENNKYLCFIGGDNPISVTENKNLPDGETCVFVKESFGNAFAPYLACNYKYVYIIDYRYYNGNISSFAKQNGAADIIIQNNISMTRNKSLVDELAGKV